MSIPTINIHGLIRQGRYRPLQESGEPPHVPDGMHVRLKSPLSFSKPESHEKVRTSPSSPAPELEAVTLLIARGSKQVTAKYSDQRE